MYEIEQRCTRRLIIARLTLKVEMSVKTCIPADITLHCDILSSCENEPSFMPAQITECCQAFQIESKDAQHLCDLSA